MDQNCGLYLIFSSGMRPLSVTKECKSVLVYFNKAPLLPGIVLHITMDLAVTEWGNR